MWPAQARALFDHRGDAAGLEGTLDLVERVAVVAHQLAGLGHIAEFFGQLQQGRLALGTLGCGGHLGSPGKTGRCGNHQSTEGPDAHLFMPESADYRIITQLIQYAFPQTRSWKLRVPRPLRPIGP